MSEAPPVPLAYHGEGTFKVTSPYWANLADRHFAVGEVVSMIRHEHRSSASHNYFFAAVADAHANLPDDIAVRFPSPDSLRRWALIQAGFCDQHTFACASKAEAQRLAAFIKPIDEYSVVVAKEATVTRYTARSQSMKAMGKKDFELSKEGVLDAIAKLIGTSRKALEASAPA